jgi:hypothetical protein
MMSSPSKYWTSLGDCHQSASCPSFFSSFVALWAVGSIIRATVKVDMLLLGGLLEKIGWFPKHEGESS